MTEVTAPSPRTAGGEVTVKQRISKSGIVAVLRAPDAAHFVQVAQRLVELGVTAIEVTLTARNALRAIAAIRAETSGEVVVGAGTVLTERDATACIHAGAEFLVAPALVPEVIRLGLSASTPVYPGAFTPSEFVAASRLGVDLVKLFPAAVVGPGYLTDLRAPLPAIDVMPTGGIRIEDVAAWLTAGAVAVGLGGPLLGDALEGGSTEALRRRVHAALAAVDAARSGR